MADSWMDNKLIKDGWWILAAGAGALGAAWWMDKRAGEGLGWGWGGMNKQTDDWDEGGSSARDPRSGRFY
jgi:hypothetical protein